MNSYKVKGIILVVIISLASIMMPFSVYADSYTITGHNVTLVESTFQNSENITSGGNTSTYNFYRYTYEIEYFLDDYYLGYIEGDFKYFYNYMPTTGSSTTLNSTKHIKVYCNSDSFKFNISFTSDLYDPIVSSSSYLTVTSASFTKFSELDSISQIIDILNDVYNNSNDIEGLSTNQLAELQTIVSNTSLANDYLEDISLLRQYNMPMESVSANMHVLKQGNYQIVDMYENAYYNYPIYLSNTGDSIFRLYGNPNNYYTFILVSFANGSLEYGNAGNILVVLESENGNLSVNREVGGNQFARIQEIKVNGYTQTGYFDIKVKRNGYKYSVIALSNNRGIYNQGNSSLEFALTYGLSNTLLDNIKIIAEGTTQSDSAASNLEYEASEYSEIADDVIGVEEGLTSNFETEVNKIDLTSGLNVFGGNFMTSATWVRTQFDRLTENTPYGSLVVYGLTLGFALLMLGKVFL